MTFLKAIVLTTLLHVPIVIGVGVGAWSFPYVQEPFLFLPGNDVLFYVFSYLFSLQTFYSAISAFPKLKAERIAQIEENGVGGVGSRAFQYRKQLRAYWLLFRLVAVFYTSYAILFSAMSLYGASPLFTFAWPFVFFIVGLFAGIPFQWKAEGGGASAGFSLGGGGDGGGSDGGGGDGG